MKIIMYLFMFIVASLGYLSLPWLIQKYQYNCFFMLVTKRETYKTDNTTSYKYILDDKYYSWSMKKYNVGDVVCSKK